MLELSLLMGGLVALSFVMIWIGFLPSSDKVALDQRIALSSVQKISLQDTDMEKPFGERIIKPVLRQLVQIAGRFAPTRNIEGLRRNLVLAGNPYGLSAIDFLGIQILVTIAAGLAGFPFLLSRGFSINGLMVIGVMLGIGFYLPLFWLKRRIGKRKSEIIKALPDALDMLTISVDAGLGFDSALLKIGEKWSNALADEFNRVIAETRIGVSRREALKGLAQRTDVPDVSNFVAVILQADQLGLSIAKVLHAQSEQLRIRRRQRAEEKARQAPTKMLFPLVFLIFPALFVVILGPA
ncbi:MAG: hypothetical protein A2Z04_05825, partial [Chloroflexi bacterium RBG_16_57_9]